MLEERYVLEKIVESCKSMSELDGKLDELDTNEMEFLIDPKADGSVTIGVQHFKAVLSTEIGNDGQTKLVVLHDAEKWHWYNIMPQKGFIFD